jgi:dephospho-CoA kinase
VVTLGVTGGLGSGKSTACKFLAEKGAFIFDADRIAKLLMESDPDIRAEITEAFGNDIYKDGKLDTQKLAQRAFASESDQRTLNDIVHPRVVEYFQQESAKLRDQYDLVVMDAPLIFESGFDSRLDHTLLIYTKYKIRLERAIRRGNLSREESCGALTYMPEEDKRELAEFVIENNGTTNNSRSPLKNSRSADYLISNKRPASNKSPVASYMVACRFLGHSRTAGGLGRVNYFYKDRAGAPQLLLWRTRLI